MLKGYRLTCSCREYTHSRQDERALLKRKINFDTKIGTVLEVLVTKHVDRYGIDLRIDSVMSDGTQSLVVISRGVEKCVTELALDLTQPMFCNERSGGTMEFVAQNPWASAVTRVFIIFLDERYPDDRPPTLEDSSCHSNSRK